MGTITRSLDIKVDYFDGGSKAFFGHQLASPGKGVFLPSKSCCFSGGSIRCSLTGSLRAKVPGRLSGAKSGSSVVEKHEKLWREFFSDPTQWWDNRAGKPNTRFPDFQHKKSGEALWVVDFKNPPWVASEVGSIAPGLSVLTLKESLSCYNKARQYEKTLKIFEQMQYEGIRADRRMFVQVLHACGALQDLAEGRSIHRQITRAGFELNLYVGSCLVDMYAKCGSIGDAWNVFKRMPTRDVVAWTGMIMGCVKCGQGLQALELFQQMQREGVKPNSHTFVGLLNACASIAALDQGRYIHEHISQSGCGSNVYVGNSLVDMYAKCGSIEDAFKVFDTMPAREVGSWNAIILGCVKCEQGPKALKLYQQMQQEGVEPNSVTFVGALNACASVGALEYGICIHRQVIDADCESDPYVTSSLVGMYAKSGSIDKAWRVFENMPIRNVVMWNAIIAGCVKYGQEVKALGLFKQMQQEGVRPDSYTFVKLLNACASIAALEEGRQVHKQIIQSDFMSSVFIGNSLVDMYAKCGSIDDAWRVFNEMPTRNVVAWSAMILGCGKCGQGMKALELFQQMQQEEVEPNSLTFVGLLNACASIAALEDGRRVHELIVCTGRQCDMFLVNSLIDMYAKCGSIDDAWRVFNEMPTRDVVAWSTMILGCVKCGQGLKALELFQQMQREGVKPTSVTFVGLLNACASLVALDEGKLVHKQIFQSGYELDLYVGNSLVDMYMKCGSIDDAWSVFNKMPIQDVVGWNTMILGCVKCGDGVKALEIFQQMQREFEPDAVTFVGVLNACASVAALEKGKLIHQQIIEAGLERNIFVNTCLVDMYAKCGSLENAERLFNNMPTRDVAAWTAMIMGYAMHGHAKEAIALFDEMFWSGSEINEVTFICLLSACSHGGLVKEGIQYFDSMKSFYNVCPSLEHHTVMVDLLARAGRLDDAEEMIMNMPFEPSASAWISLLGACRIHGNVEMGERASKRVLELEPKSSSGYVLLSNIYAAAGHWASKDLVQEQRLKKGVKKQPGRTWIEVDNKVHSFLVNDRQHPEMVKIHEELTRLSELMEEAGYVTDTSFALHDVEEEKKVAYLSFHSEKLAIAFGLISTPAGAPLLIVTNLRVCGDCHTATKFIAKVTGRAITIRDANRFHLFKNGFCSCRDFW